MFAKSNAAKTGETKFVTHVRRALAIQGYTAHDLRVPRPRSHPERTLWMNHYDSQNSTITLFELLKWCTQAQITILITSSGHRPSSSSGFFLDRIWFCFMPVCSTVHPECSRWSFKNVSAKDLYSVSTNVWYCDWT